MTPASSGRFVIRVASPGQSAFQLRRGEQGLSVFDPLAVEPALTEEEILASFRSESQAIALSVEELNGRGLDVVPVEGGDTLPQRLRQAHCEIRPQPGVSRDQFKKSLRELG